MDLAHIIALACVQGLTEFLPVSSSAHLVLVPVLFSWPDQGLAFDVATHLGTLIAVVSHFAVELRSMAHSVFRPSATDPGTLHNRRLVAYLIVASLPAIIAGLGLVHLIAGGWREPWVIGTATIGFGLLLGLADFKYRADDSHVEINLPRAVLIGCAQALALIPGTSRSGVTITAGMMLGMSRVESARFSFLLSIPVILAAASYGALTVVQEQAAIEWREFLLAVGFSAIAGFVCLRLFLRFVERVGMMPYVIYRCVLGVAVLVIML